MTTNIPITLINVDAVAFQDVSGKWIGQCIQYDIAAHAKTLEALAKAIERTIAANVLVNEKMGRKLLEGIPPAPQHFVDAFKKSNLGFSANTKLKSLNAASVVHVHDLRITEAA